MSGPTTGRATGAAGVGFVLAALGVVALAGTFAAPAANADLVDVNPVRVDSEDPANSDFLVFVEGDVSLDADESEGSIALGGDLTFTTGYNVNANPRGPFTPPTAPGDANPTALYVGGQVDWAASGQNVLRVLNGGFVKIAGGGFTALNTDANGAPAATQVLPPGSAYGSTPRIEETTSSQTPQSVGTPIDSVDFSAAFTQYRSLTNQMSACTPTLTPADASGNALERPIPPGSQVYLEMVPGQTNVVDLTVDELQNVASISFLGDARPDPSTTLLVNVLGSSYTGPMPNQALSGLNAPYVLWNFPDMTDLEITGGDAINGTIYAPNARLSWVVTQNIQGNVIARTFAHGGIAAPTTREIHDFSFDGQISCTTPTTSPTTTSPTTSPTTTSPTTSPTTTTTSPTATFPTVTLPTRSPTAVVSFPGTGGGGTGQGSLPDTGGAPGWLLWIGAALVAAGVGVVGSSFWRARG